MITRRVRHLQARAFLPGRDLERPPSKITFIHASPMLQLLRLSPWGWSLNRDYDAAKAKRYNHAVGAVAAHSGCGPVSCYRIASQHRQMHPNPQLRGSRKMRGQALMRFAFLPRSPVSTKGSSAQMTNFFMDNPPQTAPTFTSARSRKLSADYSVSGNGITSTEPILT